jgi:endonuclease/exonuclease/phosphatase family metal-dependent hydrolase
LQEIDVHTERSGKQNNQAAELGKLTGMYYYFSKAIDFQGGAYGTAILSKYPLSDTLTLPLPQAPGTEPRTLSLATVSLPNGKKIRLGNTHLDYTNDLHALAQARAILDVVAKEKIPVFLTGDFNVEAESKTYKEITKDFRATCAGDCPGTLPAEHPKKTIDFIFYPIKHKVTVEKHEVINEALASDHRPVFAKLRFQP